MNTNKTLVIETKSALIKKIAKELGIPCVDVSASEDTIHDFLSNGGVVLTENQRILQALEAKREFLERPNIRDFEGDYQTWNTAMDTYAEDRDALNTAIRHYRKLVKVDYALTLI